MTLFQAGEKPEKNKQSDSGETVRGFSLLSLPAFISAGNMLFFRLLVIICNFPHMLIPGPGVLNWTGARCAAVSHLNGTSMFFQTGQVVDYFQPQLMVRWTPGFSASIVFVRRCLFRDRCSGRAAAGSPSAPFFCVMEIVACKQKTNSTRKTL